MNTSSGHPKPPTQNESPSVSNHNNVYPGAEIPPATQKTITRCQILERLSILYDMVKSISRPVLEGEELLAMGVNLMPLVLDIDEDNESSTMLFFKPLSEQIFQQHPFGEDNGTQARLMASRNGFQYLSNSDSLGAATSLCQKLAWESSGALRANMPVAGTSLVKLTNWRYQEAFTQCMFKSQYENAIFLQMRPEFRPGGSWESTERTEKPHLMFTMKHEILDADGNRDYTFGNFFQIPKRKPKAKPDEGLLKGELLAILAAIQSRLPWKMFKKHVIFPIMIFSFIGLWGRIIQAYYDGDRLIVRKTQLFEFPSREACPLDIFVRYATCEPVGYTEELPRNRS